MVIGADQIISAHAAGVTRIEQTLHERYERLLGMMPKDLNQAREARVTRDYTGYLLKVSRDASLAEGVAAVLPYSWIYREVGKALTEDLRGARDARVNFYAEWIATYSSKRFARSTSQQVELMDRLSGDRPQQLVRDRMREHFLSSIRYEHHCWDQAYELGG